MWVEARLKDRHGNNQAWLNSSDGMRGINRPRSLVEILMENIKPKESRMETFDSGQEFDDEWRRLTGGEQ